MIDEKRLINSTKIGNGFNWKINNEPFDANFSLPGERFPLYLYILELSKKKTSA